MAELNKALRTAIASIPECLGAGYIDISRGVLLGIKSVDPQSGEIIELLAPAVANLDVDSHFFQEIIANSDNLIHVFLRSQNQDHVACFICRKSANFGMVLTKARSTIPSLEAAV